jgi:hypothetical protein
MRWRAMSGARRKSRWVGLAAAAVAGVVVSAVLLAPAAAGVLVQLLQWLLRASLWLATSVVRGDSAWTIAAAVGRGVMTALSTPSAMSVAGALLIVGAGALFGLQRLLDSEQAELDSGVEKQESSR